MGVVLDEGTATEGDCLGMDWKSATSAAKVEGSMTGAGDGVGSDEVGVSVDTLSTCCCRASRWLRTS